METPQMNLAVNGVEAIIAYPFRDRFILWEALQAAGSPVSLMGGAGGRSIPNGNKRLAVLGDKLLDLVLCEQWYPDGQAKGVYDQLRQRVGSNNNLNSIGNQAGLHTFINRAGGVTAISPVTMTATVEAILGAVYLDGGMQAVKDVMQTLHLA
ncbi:MAG: hypothetical protein Q9226_001696 [Calogaya cf. arnoldii]